MDKTIEIIGLGQEMHKAGLGKLFVSEIVELALKFEGGYDVLKIWQNETNPVQRKSLEDDLAALIIATKTKYHEPQ